MRISAQGVSPNPDYLWIGTLPVHQRLTAGAHAVTLTYAGRGDTHAKVDAVLLQPVIESKVLDDGHGDTLAIYKSLTGVESRVALPVGLHGWVVMVYDHEGKLVRRLSLQHQPASAVPVLAFGYTIASGE